MRLTGSCSCWLAGMLLIAASVAAQSGTPVSSDAPKPEAILLNGTAPIPANGGFLLSGKDEARLGVLSLEDAAGVAISGSLRRTQSYFVWTPQRPPSPGSYTFVVEDPNRNYPATRYPIQIEVAGVRAKPKLSSRVQLQRLEARFGGLCCTLGDPALRIVPSCFDTFLRRTAALSATITSDAAPSQLGQMLFSIKPVGNSFSGPSAYRALAGQLTHTMEWLEQASEYCFDVEAIDIRADVPLTYQELVPRCAPHGAIGEIAPEMLVPTEKEIDREHCPVPPPKYEARWCEVNAEACAADRGQPTCAAYTQLCSNGAAATGGAPGAEAVAGSVVGAVAGEPGTSGKPGMMASAGTGTVAARSETAGSGAPLTAADETQRRAAGCSMLAEDVGARPFAGIVMLVLAAGVRRRWRGTAGRGHPVPGARLS